MYLRKRELAIQPGYFIRALGALHQRWLEVLDIKQELNDKLYRVSRTRMREGQEDEEDEVEVEEKEETAEVKRERKRRGKKDSAVAVAASRSWRSSRVAREGRKLLERRYEKKRNKNR